ncbi:MAG: leucine-rich repeat domain-containing protein [Bacilli bacterium]|nr:leucine-rich repeat domain-containing protein [Bacilli bacterium]
MKKFFLSFLLLLGFSLTSCASKPTPVQVTLNGIWGSFNDASLVATMKLNAIKGTKLKDIQGFANPVPYFKDVHTFKGWALDMYGESPIDENYIINENTVIYAQYNVKKHSDKTYLLHNFYKDSTVESHNQIMFKYRNKTCRNVEVEGLEINKDYTVTKSEEACTITYSDTAPEGNYVIRIDGPIDDFSLADGTKFIDSTYTDGNTFIYGISLSDSNTTIPPYAYTTCDWLMAIDLPNTIKEIPDSAFNLCISLDFIDIPNDVTRIGDYAFFACPALHHVYFNSELKEIAKAAFFACVSLESIHLPDSLNILGEEAFRFCASNRNLTLGKGLSVISRKAFSENALLENLTIPNNITAINEAAFQYCSSLSDITFENGEGELTLNSSFQYDISITHIKISNRIKNMGHLSFNHTMLSELDLTANPEFVAYGETGIGVDTPVAYNYGKIIVPNNIIDSYKNDPNWSKHAAIIVGQ